MTQADEDRRREARLSPGDLECDIEGARFAHVLGVTLGGHGMRVLTDQRLARNRPLQIAIHLSERDTLKFMGQVVWDEDKNFDFTHRYISGVQFVEPDAIQCDRLHNFIQKFLSEEQTDTDTA